MISMVDLTFEALTNTPGAPGSVQFGLKVSILAFHLALSRRERSNDELEGEKEKRINDVYRKITSV